MMLSIIPAGGIGLFYIAIVGAALLTIYTWSVAYTELRRKNWIGGIGIAIMGLLIIGFGVWEAIVW